MGKESGFFISKFVICLLIFAEISYSQSPFRYDIVATSSSSLQLFFQSVSINNNGEVAFSGRKTPGGGVVFTDFLPNQPRDVIPNISGSAQIFTSGNLQMMMTEKF